LANRLKQTKPVLRPIWQIILAVFVVLSVPLLAYILSGSLDFRSNANPTENPVEVVISNISDSSATISFSTPNLKTKSLLNYGESETSLSNSSFDERRKYDSNAPELNKLHYHKLVNLKPATTYFFSLTIGNKEYTNTNYKFKTNSSSDAVQVPAPVNGSVEGGPFEEGILYIHLKSGEERSSIISELLPENGNFAINLSSATDKAGKIFLTNYSNYEVFIFSNAADKGKGGVKLTDTSSTPTIKLTTQTEEYNPQTLEVSLGESTASPTPIVSTTPEISITLTPIPTITTTPIPTPAITSDIEENSKRLMYEQINIDSNELTAPSNISISNPTGTSFSISWSTKNPASGAVAFGINKEPSSLTYDIRDTASNRTPRFSHMVDIINNNLKPGDIVNMIIVSNEREYINENEYFKYKVPQTNQAPSPESIEGKIIPDFSTTKVNKDFIVLAKISNSSWISAVVNENLNWTLSTGALLSSDLSKNITVQDNTNIDYKVFGEYNSITSKTEAFKKDSLIEITINKGLTVNELENGDQIPPGGRITGNSAPGKEITIKIGSTFTDTISADTSGKWTFEIPDNAPKGEQVLSITSDAQEILLEIAIELDELPVTNPTPTSTQILTQTPAPPLAETALNQNFLNYIYGLIILAIGIYLLRLADKKEAS
jgi:hypothetical protein